MPTCLPQAPAQSSPTCSQGLLTYSRVTRGEASPFHGPPPPWVLSWRAVRTGGKHSLPTRTLESGWGGGRVPWASCGLGSTGCRCPAVSGPTVTPVLSLASVQPPAFPAAATRAADAGTGSPPGSRDTPRRPCRPSRARKETRVHLSLLSGLKNKELCSLRSPDALFPSTKSVLAGPACVHPHVPSTRHPPTSGARPGQGVRHKPRPHG